MLHQRQVDKLSYGSALNQDEERPLIGTATSSSTEIESSPSVQSQPQRWLSRNVFGRGGPCLGLALIAVIMVFIASQSGPTQVDDDDDFPSSVQGLGMFPVPMLGRRFELDQAQNVADRSRDVYLEGRPAFVYHELGDAIDYSIQSDELPPVGCEGTVLLLRHCDKDGIKEHCDYQGFERSVFLSTLFGSDKDARWPAPSYVFALNPAHRRNPNKHNYREIETVLPVANKFRLSIDSQYTTNTGKDLAENIFALLQQGDMCGKLAIISWKHSDLPHLARKLGCGPRQGCPLDYPSASFDEAWQIKFVYAVFPRRHGSIPRHASWRVFGNVQQEGFDPLAFSKQIGDYPPGGTSSSARWEKDIGEVLDDM